MESAMSKICIVLYTLITDLHHINARPTIPPSTPANPLDTKVMLLLLIAIILLQISRNRTRKHTRDLLVQEAEVEDCADST